MPSYSQKNSKRRKAKRHCFIHQKKKKTRLRRELRKLATAGPVEQTQLLHVDKTVHNISKTALTQTEVSLLKRGPTFCPATRSFNRVQLEADLHEFYRRLGLRDYFADAPQGDQLEISALDKTKLRRKYLWQPPRGWVSSEVETLISVFHESVKRASSTHLNSDAQNISKEKRLALKQLQNRTDIVIRPAEKGSAIVVQDNTTYRDKVARQLSDDSFYKKLEPDPTMQNRMPRFDKQLAPYKSEVSSTVKRPEILLRPRSKLHTFTPCLRSAKVRPTPWQTHCELSPCTN